MRIFVALLIILGLLIATIATFVWSGSYNVAATVPHWKITHWFLGEVRERAISAQSRAIVVPSIKESKLVDIGFKNYHAMCRLCHGAPGNPRTEIAKGLYPNPPDFASKDMKMRSEAQLYWIVKNGIKMTGMPAFGPTHNEEELWGGVAFLTRLPGLRPEEYKTMVKAAGLHGEREDDQHRHKPH
jgi:mono/diheme cytochrome c family protein